MHRLRLYPVSIGYVRIVPCFPGYEHCCTAMLIEMVTRTMMQPAQRGGVRTALDLRLQRGK